ncbi:MAG: hypothetical protein QME62_11035, partial [Armatimonadota bacterium]|nr:hypothetical protein [Armatimonadota bacterium]
MLSSDLRHKLSKFNKERNTAESTESPATPMVVSLEDVVPGRVHKNDYGELYISERSAGEFSII